MIKKHVSLKPYNSFGIDVSAKAFASVESLEDLKSILKAKPSKLLVLGGGSNILLTKNVEELVLHINLKGIEICKQNNKTTQIKAAAGENWHHFVMWTLDRNLGGLENLSLIPGNIGTAPIQNIGAYGVELKDSFVSCEAVNLQTLEVETFWKEDCKFGYRNSVFKSEYKGHYIITSVTFELTNVDHKLKTAYDPITAELKQMGILEPTIQDVSKAVIAIRQSKLPDPKKLGNSGSFFKNPIISKESFETLLKQFPNMPNYAVSEMEVKIPAGWLIETAGFKGKTFGNYGIYKDQALVLVNYGGASGRDILALSKLIQTTIKTIFGVSLEREVNVI